MKHGRAFWLKSLLALCTRDGADGMVSSSQQNKDTLTGTFGWKRYLGAVVSWCCGLPAWPPVINEQLDPGLAHQDEYQLGIRVKWTMGWTRGASLEFGIEDPVQIMTSGKTTSDWLPVKTSSGSCRPCEHHGIAPHPFSS